MGLICRKDDLILEVGVLEAHQYKDNDKVMLNMLNSGSDSYYANFYCESANTQPVTFAFLFFFKLVWSLILSISVFVLFCFCHCLFCLFACSFVLLIIPVFHHSGVEKKPPEPVWNTFRIWKYSLAEMKFGMCYLFGTSKNFEKMLVSYFAYEDKLLL